MVNCENCRHWYKSESSSRGKCEGIWCIRFNILDGCEDCNDKVIEVYTPGWFSCGHFATKIR